MENNRKTNVAGSASLMSYQLSQSGIVLQLLSINMLLSIMEPSAVVYEVNARGEVVRSFWDLQHGILGGCSEVSEHDGILYTSTFHSPFMGRFDLAKMTKV